MKKISFYITAGIVLFFIRYCISNAQEKQSVNPISNSSSNYLDPLYIEVDKILSEDEPEEEKPSNVDNDRLKMDSKHAESNTAPAVNFPGQGVPSMSNGLWESQVLNLEISGMDAGDVDGDGYNEIVVTDNSDIWIFKKTGTALGLKNKIEGKSSDKIINIDLADLNNNGIYEIYVSAVQNGKPDSYIMEYRDNVFRKISDNIKLYIKIIGTAGDHDIFLAQQSGSDRTFARDVFVMDWVNDIYKEQKKFYLSGPESVYGLNRVDINQDGEEDLVFLDEDKHLRVVSMKGEVISVSSELFGVTERYFERSYKKLSGSSSDMISEKIYIPPRVLISESGDNETFEIIVCKNYSNDNSAEVHGLVWHGTDLVTRWKTKKINGHIVECQIKDFENNGTEKIVAAVILDVSKGRGKSKLLVFDLR